MSKTATPPLLRVSNDVLLEILDAVRLPDDDNDGTLQRDLKSLKALAHCNRRFRDMLAADIYQAVAIRRPENWQKAFEVLQSITRCDDVRRYAKRIYVKLDNPLSDPSLPSDNSMPPAFMPEMVHILNSATRLKRLTLELPPHHVKALEEAFDAVDVVLPTVESLDVSSAMGFVLRKCPNVTSVRTRPTSSSRRSMEESRDFRSACRDAPALVTYEECCRWGSGTLEAVATAMPNLTSLVMTARYSYDDSFGQLAPSLARFTRLRTLSILPAYDLQVGFHPPECGNVYMGPNGQEVAKQVDEEHRRANRRVAQMCFGACKSLEVLWIGNDTKATAVRNGDGGDVRSVDVRSVDVVAEDGQRAQRRG